MPWSDTTTMDQKTQFIADYLREVLSITELCELYGISRKTGYGLSRQHVKYWKLMKWKKCGKVLLSGHIINAG